MSKNSYTVQILLKNPLYDFITLFISVLKHNVWSELIFLVSLFNVLCLKNFQNMCDCCKLPRGGTVIALKTNNTCLKYLQKAFCYDMLSFRWVFPKSKQNQNYKEGWKYFAADSTEIHYYCIHSLSCLYQV